MIRLSLFLCALCLVPGTASAQETFGQVSFLNATSRPALQLTIGGDTLGSDAGLGPGDFDGPYEFVARPYAIELKDAESGEVLADISLELGDETELVLIAHPSLPRDEPDGGSGGSGIELLVLSRDELFTAGEEPALLLISFLPEEESEFTFGEETRTWPFGERIRIEGWPLEVIEARDPEGEWETFLEWSPERAEFERYQVLAIFPGPGGTPMLVRHIFFFNDAR